MGKLDGLPGSRQRGTAYFKGDGDQLSIDQIDFRSNSGAGDDSGSPDQSHLESN
jgi:hypothetical protein